MNEQDKKNILLAAISDLSGTIKMIDTKVSIMLAATSIFFGALISCRSNILKAYFYFSTIGSLKILFLILSIGYVLLTIFCVSFGLMTVLPRKEDSNSSLWFFDTKIITKNQYYNLVDNADEEYLMNSLKTEVYLLNRIVHTKIDRSKKALILFWFSFVVFICILVMIGSYYVFV